MNKSKTASGRIFCILYLSGFTFFIVKVLVTGDAVSYVHPRFIPFLWAASFFSLLIVISLLINQSGKHSVHLSWKKAVILFIPLLFAFTVPPDTLTPLSDSDTSFMQTQNDDGVSSLPDPVLRARASAAFTMDEDHFYMILQDIYDNPAVYQGKKVSLTGMVFHRKKSASGECAVLRMMMTCCSADLQPVGLVCVFPSSVEIKEKTWIHIEGKLSVRAFEQQQLPFITTENYVPVEKPVREYIYPL